MEKIRLLFFIIIMLIGLGQRKKRFLKFYGKFRHICLIFCMKLQHHKDLKLPQMFLSWGKTLFWILVKPKIVNNPGLQTH